MVMLEKEVNSPFALGLTLPGCRPVVLPEKSTQRTQIRNGHILFELLDPTEPETNMSLDFSVPWGRL